MQAGLFRKVPILDTLLVKNSQRHSLYKDKKFKNSERENRNLVFLMDIYHTGV